MNTPNVSPCIQIGSRRIGPGYPTYIVAEMSANHNQDYDQAVSILRAAKQAGADAVKLQTYTPATMTLDCDSEHFRIRGTLWDTRRLYDLYGEAYTPWEWHPKLQKEAASIGIDLFSTPFDKSAVEFLEGLNAPAYKIASFELVDIPLLRLVAKTGKPVIASTGMATLGEIEEAVRTLRESGAEQIALLKCTSAYPAPADDMHLRTITHLAQAFGVPIGLSDHTMETAVPVAAVALGACIIEKHLTLSRSVAGPDSAFSLEPAEFAEMVRHVRVAEKALGRVQYGLSPAEEKTRVFRRSLFAASDIKAGEMFTARNVRCIRPGHGLHPRHLEEVLSRRASRDIARGTPLAWDCLGATSHVPQETALSGHGHEKEGMPHGK